MATLTHQPIADFGQASALVTLRRSLLERAIAAAPSHVPTSQGWLRRLLARDQSAAALVRRYRLLPAIEHAYDRLTAELGPMPVAASVEDDLGAPYLRIVCFVHGPLTDAHLDMESSVSSEWDRLLRPRDRARLSVFVRGELPGDVVRS